MKFCANINTNGLHHFAECLLCLNKLCRELTTVSAVSLKLTLNKVSVTVKTSGKNEDNHKNDDSQSNVCYSFPNLELLAPLVNSNGHEKSELFQRPFTLESDYDNVIVLDLSIASLYEALSSALKSENVTIKLIRNRGGFLSVKFTDPLYPTIIITLDIPVNPIFEDINNNSVIPTIPPCSWNIGLSKLQSITYFLESVHKIGNDLVEFQITRNKRGPNDSLSVDTNIFHPSTLKIKSLGNIADLETVFYGLHIFSSLPDDQSVSTKEDNIKAYLDTAAITLLCRSVIDSNLYNKNKAIMIAAIPDDIKVTQWIYVILSIVKLPDGVCNTKLYTRMINFYFLILMETAHAYMISDKRVNLSNSLKRCNVLQTDFYNDKPFKLMELPYKLGDLAPEISEETVRFHYLKHHAGYVNKLNELVNTHPEIANKSIDVSMSTELMKTSDGLVYNMAAQVWNHDFYWKSLTKNCTEMSEFLKDLINQSFGSYDNFVQELVKLVTSHFGSGWVWLLYESTQTPSLRLAPTQDAGNPIRLWVTKPLLVIDVWEHAYYIDYRNDRKSYVYGWLRKVNWNCVESLIKSQ